VTALLNLAGPAPTARRARGSSNSEEPFFYKYRSIMPDPASAFHFPIALMLTGIIDVIMGNLRFPDGFLWGVATSSHQIEGGNHNDWTLWERVPGRILDRSVSGPAADHWHRYQEDYQHLTAMHLGSYRLSIEWSRVEPRMGEYDDRALAHYADMIKELKARGITPMVTLHHFTSPVWVSEGGGWANRRIVNHIEAYAMKVVELLGPDVSLWCTINEPSVLAGLAYMVGKFPPGRHSLADFIRARRNLVSAHRRLYRRIHALYEAKGWPRPQIGLAHHLTHVRPTNPTNPLDRLAAFIYTRINNGYFLSRTRRHSDYLGLNYYFARRIHFRLGGKLLKIMDEAPIPGARASDLGWPVVPEGLYQLCMSLSQYRLPIFVTENGLADAEDRLRPWSIVHHLKAVHQAIQDGADVRGYFHWTLLDSFEWENGQTPRYGLIAVDYATQQRHPRHSAKLYGEIAATNELGAKLLEQYP
jgi:beta-glucosidase